MEYELDYITSNGKVYNLFVEGYTEIDNDGYYRTTIDSYRLFDEECEDLLVEFEDGDYLTKEIGSDIINEIEIWLYEQDFGGE